MVQSQKSSPSAQYSRSVLQNPQTGTYYAASQGMHRSLPSRHPKLLLVAEHDSLLTLAKVLDNDGYIVYTTADLAAAQTILAAVEIDLVILHCPPEMGIGGWETYTELRHYTTRPVMLMSNVTNEPLATTPAEIADMVSIETMQHESATYRQAIDLLCRALTP